MMNGMQDEDEEAQRTALEELSQFARGGMDREMMQRNAPEPVPGAEPEEGAEEMCDPAACDGMAGEDGMCAKCGKMKPPEGEAGPAPDKLRGLLASMKAGGAGEGA